MKKEKYLIRWKWSITDWISTNKRKNGRSSVPSPFCSVLFCPMSSRPVLPFGLCYLLLFLLVCAAWSPSPSGGAAFLLSRPVGDTAVSHSMGWRCLLLCPFVWRCFFNPSSGWCCFLLSQLLFPPPRVSLCLFIFFFPSLVTDADFDLSALDWWCSVPPFLGWCRFFFFFFPPSMEWSCPPLFPPLPPRILLSPFGWYCRPRFVWKTTFPLPSFVMCCSSPPVFVLSLWITCDLVFLSKEERKSPRSRRTTKSDFEKRRQIQSQEGRFTLGVTFPHLSCWMMSIFLWSDTVSPLPVSFFFLILSLSPLVDDTAFESCRRSPSPSFLESGSFSLLEEEQFHPENGKKIRWHSQIQEGTFIPTQQGSLVSILSF